VQTVDVTGCQDHRQAADKILASLKAGVGNSWPDHLYKIILAGDRTLDFTLSLPVLDSLLAGQLFWYRLVDETRLPVDLADLAREHSLRGAFVRQAQSALQQATESGQAHERQILVQALDLGLAAMRGEEVWYETDPA